MQLKQHAGTHCPWVGRPKSSKSQLRATITDLANSLCQTLPGGLGLGSCAKCLLLRLLSQLPMYTLEGVMQTSVCA